MVAGAIFVPLWGICVWRGTEESKLAWKAVMEGTTYRSPLRKLQLFFERSRNGWKEKCLKAKALVKRLSKRIQELEVSRDLWKERAKRQEEELRRIRRELESSKTAVV